MLIALAFTLITLCEAPTPIVIAHRGASGYAVEHTEAAKAMAHAQGADYIEQDVVLSKDGEFIVSHDITMEETTNVEELFPNRARADGKFYFIDFPWSEIQQLTVHERTRRDSKEPAMPNRFPGSAGQRVVRLVDEIQLVQGWNQTTDRTAGLYIELKAPSFHKKELGLSMGEQLLNVLRDQDGIGDTTQCYVQCFEPDELIDLNDRLHCKLPLIQLLGKAPENNDFSAIARYSQGIGPSLELIATRNADGAIQSTGLVEAAKQAGLKVHPYTVRKHAQPKWSRSLGETHGFMLNQLKVDGFFTDYPDLGRQAVESLR